MMERTHLPLPGLLRAPRSLRPLSGDDPCLYAYRDKLSGQCEFALYDAAVRLERAINALTYVASECRAEIGSLCAGMQAGEGRIAQCLQDHAAELSETCDRALVEVGLKE